eukprot:m.513223 g.513223  ORF g.513223 m.513223 type:complete len:70 (-) comp57438_c0_seq73:77-286(-)
MLEYVTSEPVESVPPRQLAPAATATTTGEESPPVDAIPQPIFPPMALHLDLSDLDVELGLVTRAQDASE